MNQQGARTTNKRAQKKARKRERDMNTGTAEEVLGFDLEALRASLSQRDDVAGADGEEKEETVSELVSSVQ